MKLEDFASNLVAENHFIKASFGGFAGAGKTKTASDFCAGVYKDLECTKPILIIDNERGSRFLKKFFEDKGIATIVKNTTSLADVLQSFKFLEDGEVDLVFIDSLTKVWYQYIKDYRANHNNRKMTLNDWGQVIPEWQEKFSNRLVDVKGNIVFTGRGGYEYDLEEVEENGKTKKQFVRSGVKFKLQGETAFETDLNVWMEIQQEVEGTKVIKQWREAMVMKDRSGTIDGKTFNNPTYKEFKPIIDYILSVPVGEVKGTTDSTNLAPSDDYPAKKIEREKALEKIWAVFDQLGLSPQSAADKKLKYDLAEMVFGTTSKTEIEGKKLNELLVAVDVLIEFKNRVEVLTTEGNKLSPEKYKELLETVTSAS